MNHNLYLQFYPHFERHPDKVLIDTPQGDQYRYADVLELIRTHTFLVNLNNIAYRKFWSLKSYHIR